MKCPEVVEWMHRYLDNDLNEENTSEMMEHITHCSQCSETFRILKSLSHELEELPHVIPRYSLVDAIMPQIDAIDRARLEKSAAQERSADEMVPVPLPRASDPRKRFLSSTAARTMIGAVAAVGIIGVAIFTYSPEEVSEAEIQYKEEATTSTDTGDVTNDKVMKNASNNVKGVAPTSYDTVEDTGSSEPEGISNQDKNTPDSNSTQGNELEAPTESIEPISPSTVAEDPDSSSVKVNDPSQQALENSNPSAKVGEDKAKASGADTTRVADTSQIADTSRIAESNPEDAPMSKVNVDPPKEDSSKKITDGIDPIPTKDTIMSGITSFSATVTPQSWDSPDGKVTAVLENEKLVIYQLPIEGEVEKSVIQSIKIVGTWVTGGWSSDGKVFTYQTSVDDKVTDHTYNYVSEAPTP